MLDCGRAFEAFRAAGVDFYAGVPDSLLKDFCAYVTDRVPAEAHVIAANEGAAVALAAGHHLASGGLGLVYMQNSGLGNAVNPLLSLADPEVYAIPLLLLIGWRGEPGRHDEPQHVKQGRVTLPLLAALEIESVLLPAEDGAAAGAIAAAAERARALSAPVALVVRAGTFAPHALRARSANAHPLSREQAVQAVAAALPEAAAVVSTTGMTSRELFEYRVARGEDGGRDFLTVGSMGHASQIALGLALARPEQTVVCLDGDGAVLMHMGALALIAARRPARFVHVVLNNGVHDSVGGQPTAGVDVDLPAAALACGYAAAERVAAADELGRALAAALERSGPTLLEVRIHPGARPDLGRPRSTPVENKRAFVARLRRPR